MAFLIPVIETLYRQKWNSSDGLGALIVSPTRELALQIFSVLRKIGKFHSLSAGLIIGGKDFGFEKGRVSRMNILVCTPGRLLQHMDETPNFDANNLQILVLDEADRILDLGFEKTMNAILDNLPQRQTLLFSATQTKKVSDLARLSLSRPEYVAVHERDDKSTPDSLEQSYVVCNLDRKLDVLYSFVKTHLKSKVLVFLSSCKQVRFVYETFCKLQPGTVIMCLHGKQKQSKRNLMFDKFCKSNACVMLCTDIAARGLDFPAVDWVVQVDCFDDAETYIHRVGRTARYKSEGKSLLILCPSEEQGALKELEAKKVPIQKMGMNVKQLTSIQPKLMSFCAESTELKYLGEKAFICYLRSVWVQKNKQIFDVNKLPVDEFAYSLGLSGAPKVKFIKKTGKNFSRSGNVPNSEYVPPPFKKHRNKEEDSSEEYFDDGEEFKGCGDSDGNENEPQEKQVKTKIDKLFNKKNQIMLWDHSEKIHSRDDEVESEDDFLTIKRKDHALEGEPEIIEEEVLEEKPKSVRDKRKEKLKHRVLKAPEAERPVKLVFDDDGVAQPSWQLETEGDFLKEGDVFSRHQKYLEASKNVMDVADAHDKEVEKTKRKEKKLERKRKLKERMNNNGEEDVGVQLEPYFEQKEEESDDQESEPEQMPQKKAKISSLEEAEELALRLLNQ